jgi:integrase/recombinase XerC
MQNWQLTSPTRDFVPIDELDRHVSCWLLDCEISSHSPATIALRRLVTGKLLWFLKEQGLQECGTNELRAFMAYLTRGHRDADGRFGNAKNVNRFKAPKPGTIATYRRHLCTFFRWLVKDGQLGVDPMARVGAVVDRPDEVQPFTDEQANALLNAAKESKLGPRNYAALLMLFDTGLRASELCGLTIGDLDLSQHTATVEGKGGKRRQVCFGAAVARALWAYLKTGRRDSSEPVFASERGGHLTTNALYHIVERLGEEAGITGVRCSPHTARHYAAISFLRAGGNTFTLQKMLGHTDLKQTRRYSQIADADVATQHRMYSPVERLMKKGAK